MTCSGGLNKGFDGGKSVKGRKRHIAVNSMDLFLTVVVYAVDHHDAKASLKVEVLIFLIS